MQIELWQIHHYIMITGFILLIFVALIRRLFINKPWWFRLHKTLGTLTAITIIASLFIALYMVGTTSGLHFTQLHSWLGISAIILTILHVSFAYLRPRLKISRRTYRIIHISDAVFIALLIAITIFLGFALVL